MKKEKSPKNKRNNIKSGLKWKYHEKFKQKYETYLMQNINSNNLRLKGNYHYENKPIKYYLDKKELKSIKNTNLTPLPQSKYLNQKTKEKNLEEYKEFSNIQKNVIQMRRIEYNIKFPKKKEKEKEKVKFKNLNLLFLRDDDKYNKEENNNKIRHISKRKSCIQFHHSIFLFDKKRKTLSPLEIKNYLLSSNLNNLSEDEIPKEVKIYLKTFESKVVKIQKKYKEYISRLKKITKIQTNYKAHLYSKLFKDFLQRKNKMAKFIYKIQKTLFLNLYRLKVNPKLKYASKKYIFTKYIYTIENIYKIIHLQREIKYYLFCKKLKIINKKKKCLYVKPYTIIPLDKILLLQRNITLFLERLKRRHKMPTSQIINKRVNYTKKIVLIQRLARAIHVDEVYPTIPKQGFHKNNVYVKGNRKKARKKFFFIDLKILPFGHKDINVKVRSKNTLITKSHKYLEKIIFLQRFIKIYFSREDYDIYDYPKEEEYITKESNVLQKKDNLLHLQNEIKYFLYRQKIRINMITKKVIEPLKCTKTIRTNTEKIFTRLSKLRILYDKEMIIFIVKLIEVIKNHLAKICFNAIKKESQQKEKFVGKNVKISFVKKLASSNFMKGAIFKVIEPEYNIESELKKLNESREKNKDKEKKNNSDINTNHKEKEEEILSNK